MSDDQEFAARVERLRARIEAAGYSLAVKCTCPSGDGSLRWPCPQHPPTGIRPEPHSEDPS